jgi:hypothetical protein
VLVAAGISLAMIVEMNTDPLAQRAHWPAVTAALRHHEPGRRAIVIDGSRTWGYPIAFYLPHTWWVHRHGIRVHEIDLLRRIPTPQDCNGQTWWGALCDMGGRHAPKQPPVPGVQLVAIQHVAGFEIRRYIGPHAVRIYPYKPFDRPLGPWSGPHHQVLVTPEYVPYRG